jgi:hypothetical protein
MIHLAIFAGAHLAGLAVGAAVTALVGAATIILWHKILGWAQDNVLPWVREHLPSLAPHVEKAFSAVDKAVVAVRLEIKAAWDDLRKILLKQVARFEQHVGNTWLVEVTSWLRAELQGSQPKAIEIRTVRSLSFDEVPFEIREQAYRVGQGPYELDITSNRDAELALAMAS